MYRLYQQQQNIMSKSHLSLIQNKSEWGGIVPSMLSIYLSNPQSETN